MAEPPTVLVVREHDALLATKLHLPRPRPGVVARPRLLARLSEGMRRELVLVSTPAGFGKTTLLAEWVRAGQRPAAWRSLDEADNDPARFWRHVAAGLDSVHPGIAERVRALLGPPPLASFEAPVKALVNELAELAEDVVLVLDDYHVIHSAAVHASVEFLLQHSPPTLRLVLASRADPPYRWLGCGAAGS
jgi:LuxR family transcriptional regulator, maltose regulon positive regulatory protein